MKVLFNKILLLSLFIIIGCSKSEDVANEVDNTPTVNSLEVFVSSDEVIVGTTILFTVFDNTGKNRTSEAKFYVDGTEISGSSYTFNDVGTLPSPDPSLMPRQTAPQQQSGNGCSSCGAELRPNSKFCTKCGAKV